MLEFDSTTLNQLFFSNVNLAEWDSYNMKYDITNIENPEIFSKIISLRDQILPYLPPDDYPTLHITLLYTRLYPSREIHNIIFNAKDAIVDQIIPILPYLEFNKSECAKVSEDSHYYAIKYTDNVSIIDRFNMILKMIIDTLIRKTECSEWSLSNWNDKPWYVLYNKTKPIFAVPQYGNHILVFFIQRIILVGYILTLWSRKELIKLLY